MQSGRFLEAGELPVDAGAAAQLQRSAEPQFPCSHGDAVTSSVNDQ